MVMMFCTSQVFPWTTRQYSVRSELVLIPPPPPPCPPGVQELFITPKTCEFNALRKNRDPFYKESVREMQRCPALRTHDLHTYTFTNDPGSDS